MRKINIQVSKDTHERLSQIGRKGDSFDDIVKMLLKFYLEHQ